MYYKTHFIAGTNSYMFRDQNSILKELNKKKGSVSPTVLQLQFAVVFIFFSRLCIQTSVTINALTLDSS